MNKIDAPVTDVPIAEQYGLWGWKPKPNTISSLNVTLQATITGKAHLGKEQTQAVHLWEQS
jgi:hypothetical protein